MRIIMRVLYPIDNKKKSSMKVSSNVDVYWVGHAHGREASPPDQINLIRMTMLQIMTNILYPLILIPQSLRSPESELLLPT